MGQLWLQFGHGGEAVETKKEQSSASAQLGFNSATAVKPWKLERGRRGETAERGLQFGHGGEAVETGAEAIDVLRDQPLQFGHGGEAVETLDSARACQTPGLASIRPRR